MIDYDRSLPLISLHIPKMGGTSFRIYLESVFGNRLLTHYNKNEIIDGINVVSFPAKYRWDNVLELSKKKPICIHGHFRTSEQTSPSDYYPQAKQFITLLRNPFESAVSNYYYMKKIISEGQVRDFPFLSINDYLDKNKSVLMNHLFDEMIHDPLKSIEENFVAIGCIEKKEEFSIELEKIFNDGIIFPHVNEAKRNETIDHAVKKRWLQRHKVEMEIFNYVLKKG